MKLAFIATSLIPSTTANSMEVMKVCQAFQQLGHEICLWVPGDQPHGWEELQGLYGLNTQFPIRWVKGELRWRKYDFALESVQQALKFKADALYTWTFQAAVIALGRKLPVIMEVHDRPRGRSAPLLFQLFLRIPGKKRILPITAALQHILEQDYRVTFSPQQAVVAPSGVEIERFENLPDPVQARSQLGLPEQSTAVYAGHFYPGRGLDLLAALAKAYPQVHFLWVGGKPEAVQEWRDRLAGMGLHNITLTGFVENQHLPQYLAAGDILLMPYERAVSVSGGGNTADVCSPMKLFEYLATGRAILSSDLPVFHEVLDENNCAFCPPEDTQAWIETFGELIASPERRSRLARQALLDAPQYSWKRRAERSMAGF